MATNTYMAGRKKYQRPQAMLWSENPGIISNGKLIPDGLEIGTDPDFITSEASVDQFLILSDDNRNPLDFNPIRIEKRERMINGRMRSYHIADKLTLSTSWTMLPSRGYASYPDFNLNGISPDMHNKNSLEYTSDGGAGGVDILDWYNNHKGSFWVFLSYDKRSNFGNDESSYTHLTEYSQVIEMFIADFNYSVQKRGGSNHDFWNISITLEEV